MYSNPFTPVFGNEPPFLAGRTKLIDDVLNGLEHGPGDPNRVTIFTGPRGSGKTVLLAKIAADAEAIGWISVHTPAIPGMINSLLEQVPKKAAHLLPKENKSKVTGIQFSGVGISRELLPANEPSWRLQMESYLDSLAEQNVGLLFTIDEVSVDVAELVEFIAIFQVFVMEKRNVALLLAGLPTKVLQMFQNDSISFLRRALRRKLESVSIQEASAAMKKTIAFAGRSIDNAALSYAAKETQGFPFAIQLIGYNVFNQSAAKKITLDDAETGVVSAREDMSSMVLDATIFGLSDTDLSFLIAMLPDTGISRIADIAKRMETSPSNASHYRRRLLNLGILAESGRGKVEFAMPMLKELLQDRYEDSDMPVQA
jgi:hypothetical protein